MDKNVEEIKRKWFMYSLAFFVVIVFTLFCKIMGYSMIFPLLFVVLGLHLRISCKVSSRTLLSLGLLVSFLIFLVNSLMEYTTLSIYVMPVASITMLTMLIFKDHRLNLIIAFITSMFVSHMLNEGFSLMVMFFVGSIVGGYMVYEARTRDRLIIAGILVSLVQAVAIILSSQHVSDVFNVNFLKEFLYPSMGSGIASALIVAATLKIFESVFGVLTNFSLLELSDFQHPLLKRMILEAPGTYHHSLVVSNLAESASNAIGANGLLARVGAYYHDIGKMTKPEYFTENQIVCGNKHDNIEPSMSCLVIINHVKEGIELAKKYKLNSAIVDFIPQHHGTSLIYFFHKRAVEEAGDVREVKEENYRYPGPKPQTRETAITLLADSVEGATRALDEHTPSNIQVTVQKIINNKFIDGQLDECPLTLKEIDKIAETFVHILSAMYHGRIKYPEKKKENENIHKKSTEENTH